jgi:1-acyl-sn-glycerol-3-phosphate acyltransferase
VLAALRTLLAVAVLVVATALVGVSLAVGGLLGRREAWVPGLVRRWGRALTLVCGVRLEVEGAHRLDPSCSYVLAGNHQSALDIPVLMVALPNHFGFLAKKELFHIPVFGRLMRLTGQVPVDRGEARAAVGSLREAARRLEQGHSILVFPEGTRSQTEQMLPFKSGAFQLALHSGRPVVPVAISGTRAVLPPGRWLLQGAGRVRVSVGEPIEVAGRRRQEVSRQVRERLEAALERGEEPRHNQA